MNTPMGLLVRLAFMAGLLMGGAVIAATPAPTKPKPSVTPKTAPAKNEDAATANRKKEARREKLAKTIAYNQQIIDTYERQSSFKPGPKVSQSTYETAVAARNAAQTERDSLAN